VWQQASGPAPTPNPALTQYLSATGFKFDYAADGASVYRPASAG
jgi:hypothetical protein